MTFIIPLIIGGIIGFLASLLANAFTQPFLHWFFSLKIVNKCFKWSIIFNKGHRYIHKCSSIQRCNLEAFSDICFSFVENTFIEGNNKYIIFNSVDPCFFYNQIKGSLEKNLKCIQLFREYENAVHTKQFSQAKETLNLIYDIYINIDIPSLKHLKILSSFRHKYRIQFMNFDMGSEDEKNIYIDKNELHHFIFFNEFINKDVRCFWTRAINEDEKILLNGIVIDDKYLFDFNVNSSSLFFARDRFSVYNQSHNSIEPYYNKYISMINSDYNNYDLQDSATVSMFLYNTDYNT